MDTTESIMVLLELLVVTMPVVLVALLGIPSLLGAKLSEEATAAAWRLSTGLGLVCCLGVLALMLFTGTRHEILDLGNWVAIHDGASGRGPHFAVKFEFDRLSVPLAILSFVLCGTISAFAAKYMHREPGFNRFFVLLTLFLAGMVIASLADTIETLFTGWELVGLSSRAVNRVFPGATGAAA